jgi:hypothetical protein
MLIHSVSRVTRRSIIVAMCEATIIATKAEARMVQIRRVAIEIQTKAARVATSMASTP